MIFNMTRNAAIPNTNSRRQHTVPRQLPSQPPNQATPAELQMANDGNPS